MFKGLRQLFSPNNKDLRKRIYFTLACLGFFCLGTSITIPWASVVYEELGFLEKTHTSSGRIPSESGYHYYVENLMKPKDMTGEDMLKLQTIFHNHIPANAV